MNWWKLLAASLFILCSYAIWLMGVKVWIWQILPPHSHTIYSILFIVLFIGGALWNRITAGIRRRTGIYHAYDRGRSVFSNLIDMPYLVYAWIEPLFLLSLATYIPDFFVKAWLILCGISLFLHSNIDLLIFHKWAVDDRKSSQAEAAEYQTKTIEHTARHVTTIVAKRR